MGVRVHGWLFGVLAAAVGVAMAAQASAAVLGTVAFEHARTD